MTHATPHLMTHPVTPPLRDLHRAADTLVDALNTWHTHCPQTPVVAERHGDHVKVLGEGGEEHLTLSTHENEHFISGRGGRYPLDWRGTPVVLAHAVADPATRRPVPGHPMTSLLAAHGFVLEEGPSLRFKYDFWITTLHAWHPDGRVIWFQDCDYDTGGRELAVQTLECGVHRVGALYIPADEEGMALRIEALDACPEAGPDASWQYTWRPRAETIAALCLNPAGMDPLPGEWPSTFFHSPEQTPGVTRRDLFPEYLRAHVTMRRGTGAVSVPSPEDDLSF